MAKTIFLAKFDYTCGICKRQHKAGTRSLYENKELAAADCKWPGKSNTDYANPIASGRKQDVQAKGAGEPSLSAMPPAPQPLTDSQIAEMLTQSRKQIAAFFGMDETQIDPNNELVARLFGAKLGQHILAYRIED